jgi:hypothetical protein
MLGPYAIEILEGDAGDEHASRRCLEILREHVGGRGYREVFVIHSLDIMSEAEHPPPPESIYIMSRERKET